MTTFKNVTLTMQRLIVVGVPVAGIVALILLRPFGLQDHLPRITLPGLETPTFTAQGCDPRHPSFQYGFAVLKQQLGPVMGDPTDCEHAIHVTGDTRQSTTTGYAYYRTTSNIPAFARGSDRWALTDSGLVHWSGDVVDPPRN